MNKKQKTQTVDSAAQHSNLSAGPNCSSTDNADVARREEADTLEEQCRRIKAEIGYLLPSSTINRRFCSPHADVNTGRYGNYSVTLRDGSLIPEHFKADVHGFQLVGHSTSFSAFEDSEAIRTLYEPEMCDLVKQVTGADCVVSLGCALRTAGDAEARNMGPPASEAHVDFETKAARAYAKSTYEEHFPDGPGYSRFIASSVWRPLSSPPHDWPLAVCDYRSVNDDEGLRNVMVVVDKLPEEKDLFAPIEYEDRLPAAFIFPFNPAHRWWYFSKMTSEEVLFIKFHDSDQTRAWRGLHTAFHDTGAVSPNIRESIEFRTMAYFL